MGHTTVRELAFVTIGPMILKRASTWFLSVFQLFARYY